MSRGIKEGNNYQKLLSAEFYEKCPKSVLAAIAVSFIINHQGSDNDNVEEIILHEWKVLNQNGIVPQKPYREGKNAEDIFG